MIEQAIIDARKAFGEKVRQARQSQGMTQNDLAEKSGIKQMNISRIESGKYGATLDTITRLSIALNTAL